MRSIRTFAGVGNDCFVPATGVALAAAVPFGNVTAVPISVSGFASVNGDMGAAAAAACAAWISGIGASATPRPGGFTAQLAAAGFPGVAGKCVATPTVSILYALTSTLPAGSNISAAAFAQSVDNAVGGGALSNSLAANGVAGGVSRPKKFSSDGCLPASAPAPAPAACPVCNVVNNAAKSGAASTRSGAAALVSGPLVMLWLARRQQ